MPNPKAGCVVPPGANLKQVYDRLQKTIRLQAKGKPVLYATIGREDIPEDHLGEHLFVLYDQLIRHLPAERKNIKSFLVKSTMGKPLKVL
jgi:ribosomal protein L1